LELAKITTFSRPLAERNTITGASPQNNEQRTKKDTSVPSSGTQYVETSRDANNDPLFLIYNFHSEPFEIMPARTRKRAKLPEPETEEPPVTLNTVVEAHFMDIGTVTDTPTNLKVLSHDFEVQTIPGEYQTKGKLYYSLIGNHLQNWDLTDIDAFVGSKADKVMVDAVPRPSTPTPSRGLIKTCAKCDEEQKWAIQAVKHHEAHCKIAINQDLEELISPKPKVYRGLGHLPLPAEPEIIFSHGKTRGIDDPGFIHFVEGMARFFNILCFQGNASQNDRLLSYRYFLDDAVRTCKAMGGRSVGSLSAVRASIYTTNKKFILWSFPLVQDMENMEEVLLALPADAKVLFIRGSKDFVSILCS
jgi:hypothetical protein